MGLRPILGHITCKLTLEQKTKMLIPVNRNDMENILNPRQVISNSPAS